MHAYINTYITLHYISLHYIKLHTIQYTYTCTYTYTYNTSSHTNTNTNANTNTIQTDRQTDRQTYIHTYIHTYDTHAYKLHTYTIIYICAHVYTMCHNLWQSVSGWEGMLKGRIHGRVVWCLVLCCEYGHFLMADKIRLQPTIPEKCHVWVEVSWQQVVDDWLLPFQSFPIFIRPEKDPANPEKSLCPGSVEYTSFKRFSHARSQCLEGPEACKKNAPIAGKKRSTHQEGADCTSWKWISVYSIII